MVGIAILSLPLICTRPLPVQIPADEPEKDSSLQILLSRTLNGEAENLVKRKCRQPGSQGRPLGQSGYL